MIRRSDSAQAPAEASVSTHHDESLLQQSRLWMRTVTWSLVATTAFGVGWLALAKTEEIVVAPGKLEPIDTVQDITLPVGGVAQKILVRDGDQVSQGQVLIQLDNEASEERRKALERNITLKTNELALKQEELRRYLELNQEEVRMLEKNLTLDQEILSRLETLAREGASAELQYLQQQNQVQETQGRLMQSRVDRLRQTAILNQAMKQLNTELTDLRGQLAETNVTLRYQALRSPVDGVVFDLRPTGIGYAAQTTETVMKVVPFGALEARVEVPSNQIGFVRTGMPADISIDSFPASDFGVLEGTVTRIGSDALPPDPQTGRQEPRFPTTIELASQQLKLRSGTQLPLQVGMSLTANIKLRKVSYLQLLLSNFKDKADSLRQL
ncbi:HlyD family efflux transporter periplasmic adaptor subunit [Synechococcus sp. RSCCF101]|uniref:HlyD family secretion protein n=1 Tax=Synechococcus sp. RSCCF101 TaxID=2511069 RepID=UPI001248E28E|nr:HlyD family efflux transporter periplasmic adaptor subunit [Synechococcus sp. RSCCF101]QEY32339.1 HlyD family efflux transporter periplasmic adaptor subunit [Synechococcus sp. RSCCF101]